MKNTTYSHKDNQNYKNKTTAQKDGRKCSFTKTIPLKRPPTAQKDDINNNTNIENEIETKVNKKVIMFILN